MTTPVASERVDVFDRVVDNLDANFGVAPHKRAAHAKGVVLTGHFTASPEAASVSRAGHLSGRKIDVVARFSSFPGGAPHPDAAPECNPRGLAVQFRLPGGATTDLLAHSIDGFPGRTVDDFADFLAAIAPGGDAPGYLAEHAAAAAFVGSIQSHGVPASYATLSYWPVNAFVFQGSRRHDHDRPLPLGAGRGTPLPHRRGGCCRRDGLPDRGPRRTAGRCAGLVRADAPGRRAGRRHRRRERALAL